MRTLLAALAIAVTLLAGGALYARHWLSQPLPLGAAPVVIEIQPGQSLTAVTRDLAARGLVRHPRLLALYGRFTGVDSRKLLEISNEFDLHDFNNRTNVRSVIRRDYRADIVRSNRLRTPCARSSMHGSTGCWLRSRERRDPSGCNGPRRGIPRCRPGAGRRATRAWTPRPSP